MAANSEERQEGALAFLIEAGFCNESMLTFYYVYAMLKGTALDKWMWRVAYFYLLIPFMIFCFGWLNWFYSIPVAAIVLIAFFHAIHSHKNDIATDLTKHRKMLWLCLAVLVVWVFFSGIGQFSYQNGDHYFRNAILKDLVEQPWPLVYDFSNWQPYGVKDPGEYMLVYYLGYWMPAGLFGKIFGLQAAHVFLFVWTITGVALAFYFTCRYLKKIRFWMLLLFMLFGGMDVIPFLLDGNYHPLLHLEWWRNGFQQFTSQTSLLYWVFNQAVIPWLIIGMMMNHLPKKNFVLICALCLFYAPFPFIGLIPFAVYFFFERYKSFRIKESLSYWNIIAGVLVTLVAFGYFSSVTAEKSFNLYIKPFTSNLVFYLVEFLLVAIVIFLGGKRNLLVCIATLSLVLLSFIQYRHTPDLMMRASIPALFILMILSAELLVSNGKKSLKYVLFVLLAAGAITSLNEITRSIYFTSKYWYQTHIRHEKPGIVLLKQPNLFQGRNPVIITVLGDTRSVFYRKFCRQNKQAIKKINP